jgi:hypothetical protein
LVGKKTADVLSSSNIMNLAVRGLEMFACNNDDIMREKLLRRIPRHKILQPINFHVSTSYCLQKKG